MMPLDELLEQALQAYVGHILARSIVKASIMRAGLTLPIKSERDRERLAREIRYGLKTFMQSDRQRSECEAHVRKVLAGDDPLLKPTLPSTVSVPIAGEGDVVSARGTARSFCISLGFPISSQMKVTTAVSELARNILQYAVTGEITIRALDGWPRGVEVVASDQGPGIANVEAILSGDFTSSRGMGMGLRGTKRLMDDFTIRTSPGAGTTVRIRKYLR